MNNHIPNNNLLCKVLLSFVMLLMLGGRAAAQDKEAYVVVSTDSTTLYFYYDDQRSAREGVEGWTHGIEELDGFGYPKWNNVEAAHYAGHHPRANNPYQTVVFDESFKEAQPKSCYFWFNCDTKLTEIKGIENLNTENVTNMMDMFYNCSNLTVLDLSNFNTKNVMNMEDMFNGCSSLTALNVSNFDTKNVTNMNGMFGNNSGLTSLDLSKFNTVNVTQMVGMFSNCSSLTSLNVSNFNTGIVTNMGVMFSNCSSLTTLDVSNFNTGNVRNMGGMFTNCSSLTAIDVSKFNTENVTDMNSMFNDCSSLTAIDVSNFNTENVEDMHGMFSNCSSLTTLDVSNFNTGDVTNMGELFSKCSRLTSLDVSNFDTRNVTVMNNMFEECFNLTTLDVSKFNTGKVTTMSWMFLKCISLTTLDVSNFNTDNVGDMTDMFCCCSRLTTLDLSNFNTAKVISMSGMFLGCDNLTTILVDKNKWSTQSIYWDNLDLDAEYNAPFADCPNLIGNAGTKYDEKHINIINAHIDEGEDPGYLTTDSYKVFYDLDGDGKIDDITTVDWDGATPPTSFALTNTPELPIPNPINKKGFKFKGWKGTPITGLTEDNPQTDISIPAGAVGNRIYTAVWEDKEAYAVISDNGETVTFYYDLDKSKHENAFDITEIPISTKNNVTSIVISESFKNYKPKSCAYWFAHYYGSVQEIVGWDNLNTEEVTNMQSMFEKSSVSGIANLDFSHFNTSKVTNMRFMFLESPATTLDLSSFDTRNVTDMHGMFADSWKLGSIFVGDNWSTSSVTDGRDMFSHCESLYGGKCTAYNENFTDESYARIDEGESNPGYLTRVGEQPCISNQAYAVFSDGTLTFYYDKNKANFENAYEMRTVSFDGWSDIASDITKVVFDKSFADFYPTSCVCWFCFCNNLTEIVDMEKYLNTEKVLDMSSMFGACNNLKTIDFNNFNTAKVASFNYMFASCSNLSSLDLSHFNTENVTDMYGMFDDCSSLNTIFVSDSWSTSSVTSSDIMFDGCDNLYGGQCSAYKQYQVSDASYARIDGGESAPGYFTRVGEPGCTNHSEAYGVFSDGTLTFFYDGNKPENAYPFGQIYELKSEITKVVFDKSFADYKPTSLTSLFAGYNNLSEIIDMEKYLNTENVTNMHSMFFDCYKLTELDLSRFNTENVTDMEAMFFNCDQLTELDLSNFSTENVTDMSSLFHFCNNLQNIKFGNFNTKNVKDMSHMFYECNKLESLDLSSFNTENVENMNTMFRQCHSLSTLDLHNFNTSKVTDMGHMFCESNFVELDLSNFNTEKVKDMNYMFGNCSYLKNINLSSFDTKNVENMEQMFCNCEQLEKLDLSNFNTENVTNMRGMFGAFWYEDGTRVGNGCNSLVSLDLSSFNTAKVTDMRSMFAYCSNLTAIVVDKNKWSTQSVSKTFDDVYGYKTPFENVINLIGNAGTQYNESHTDIDYAHIDEGESNPGYLTTESYKVFYNLDGGDWNGVDYPKSFAIDLKENIQIPTPKKKGYRFLGWTGTLASGITGNTPIKNVAITPDKPGNRIYTAHWEEENLDKTITFPSTPKEPEAFCNGDEKKVVLRYDTQVVYDVAKYKISLDDIITNEEEITEQNGEYQIDIPIPENTEPGTYSGKIEFYNANNAKTAEYPVKIQVAAAKNIILNLYEDVIFADNHSGLYAADGWQWYKNGEPIKNANRQYYFERPFKQGSYMVEMKTIKDGTTVYSCPIVVTHDILKNAKSPVTSYPNPAVGGKDVNLYIVDYNCEIDYTIILSNTQGVIVRTINNAAETSTLSLPQGIYSGALISNGSKKGFKLIVK